ncbi:response regulator [Paenibacillus sp. MMS20-IR301]|uniref:response regulator n=1 Tax=Paenibacillus sp. MMS20-IR301 TaxID=2895946 RepID=UPI0028E1F563|nr:response regulator [Paenibacillus sp. MMS20-IR301]WNS41416.1 response regulator [Paenibacillus sp. MMS20-IR301]
MLRIVIVDDEILIREGLARMISKESSEFTVIQTFPDGKPLLEALPSLQFDLLITDIRMPQIGGLELIRLLKASHPQIRSLLMSGFVEFDYAREAIRSSAVDYLLKPINKEQLFEVLYSLDNERKLLREQEQRHRSGLLLSLLQVEEPSPILLRGLILPQPYFTVFVLKASSPETVCASTDSLRQAKDSLFDSLELRRGQHVWIWYSGHPLTPDELLKLRTPVEEAGSGQCLHIGISRSYADPAMLRTAYLEAKSACDRGIYQPQPLHYVTIEELALPQTAVAGLFAPFRDPLIHDLQILNVPGVLDSVHKLFLELAALQAYPEQIVGICREIQALARKELPEFEAVCPAESAVVLEERIQSGLYFAVMEEQFTSALSSALTAIRTHRLELSVTAVETIKRWITANYNQHADLNTLAGMVYLTPTYLSKLFKQETGLTLTDYMIEIRIRTAKGLLKNAPDLKIHEIGSEVGYPDPAYFNKLFKKVVGVTPNEYKRISSV